MQPGTKQTITPDLDVAHEISRLTEEVTALKGPPMGPAAAAKEIPLARPLMERDKLGTPGTEQWLMQSATQANAIADNILRMVKSNPALPRTALLALGQAALDISDGLLKSNVAIRAKETKATPQPRLGENDAMNAMTREELDAKLELTQARSDARLDKALGELRSSARERELQADARLARFEERIDLSIGEMQRDRNEVKAAIGNLKSTTVVTAISAVLAIVLGVAAFNATVLSNMVASFESGRNTADMIAKSAELLRQAQELSKNGEAKPPSTK